MPQQAVIREDHTTTKLRLVYDVSSKLKDPSLNDCLEAGESRYTNLFGFTQYSSSSRHRKYWNSRR